MSEIPGQHIIFYQKCINQYYTYCNNTFLRYTGISSREKIIGLKDSELCWAKYAEIYDSFELNTLEGKQFSNFAPIINYKNEELWFVGNKYLRYDDSNNIIGTESTIMEIQEPKLIELGQFLKKHYFFKSFSVGKRTRYTLSKREQECLFYILRGKSAKEIGRILNLTPRTIEHYIENIKYKLNCRTKVDLIIKAKEEDFLDAIPESIFSNMLIDTLK